LLEIPLAYVLAIPLHLHSKGVFLSIVIAEARSRLQAWCCSREDGGSGNRF